MIVVIRNSNSERHTVHVQPGDEFVMFQPDEYNTGAWMVGIDRLGEKYYIQLLERTMPENEAKEFFEELVRTRAQEENAYIKYAPQS